MYRYSLWVLGICGVLMGIGVENVWADESGDMSCTSASGSTGTCVPSGNCPTSEVIFGAPCASGVCCQSASGGSTASSGSSGGACAGTCTDIPACSRAGGLISGSSGCTGGGICCVGGTGSTAPTTDTTGTTSGGGPAATEPATVPSVGGTPLGVGGAPVGCPAGTMLERGICIPTGTGLSRGETTSTSFDIGFFTFSIHFICTLGPVACVLATFMNWILSIVGMVAIISFVVAGMQYLLAFGEPKELEKAKTHFKWSIIGVIVALSGMVVIYAVDSLLSGSSRF